MSESMFLAVEDISKVSQGIKERIITELGISENNFHCCSFADDAIIFLRNNSPNIIIVDLAMASDGLPKDIREATKHARLTGWIFLKEYVISGEFKDKLINTHCYIFSGYGKIFSKEIGITFNDGIINVKAINDKLKEFRNNLYFVPKKGVDGGATELVKAIKEYSNALIK